jgi:hypothetical protein
MLHPPGAELLLSRLRQRQKKQGEAAAQEKQEEIIRDVIGIGSRAGKKSGRSSPRGR